MDLPHTCTRESSGRQRAWGLQTVCGRRGGQRLTPHPLLPETLITTPPSCSYSLISPWNSHPSVIIHKSSVTSHQSSAIGHRPPSHQGSVISYIRHHSSDLQSSVISHTVSVIRHQPSDLQSSAISHTVSVISYQPSDLQSSGQSAGQSAARHR